MNAPVEIPIFPLNTVLFPGGRLPLRIFEMRYVDMTKACIRDDAVFGVCQILEGREAGEAAVPVPIGCTARIAEWEVPTPGLFNLDTRGEQVFRILDQRVERDGLIRAQVVLEPAPVAQALPTSQELLGRMLSEIIDKVGAKHFPQPVQLGDATWVAYRLAEILPISVDQKLAWLQYNDPVRILAEIEATVFGEEDSGTE
ncbi:LON peptidase substrate-binding domain-containing protein [Panacagrimonas sp.]|uniref:LON peptidase substrate-binding domain-containing protein n=1 Tax=Panacagrimonas sp. TaxID=2480088 RepID=UPI003B517C34